MTNSLNETPRANRLHIGIFGKRNNGKSSLINAITGHNTALVSEVAGTTTDPVYKSMEIHCIGPVVLIDTAGLDDVGKLGGLRVERTREALSRSDIALFVFVDQPDMELEWLKDINKTKTKLVTVINKADNLENIESLKENIKSLTGQQPVVVSAQNKSGIKELIAAITRSIPDDYDQRGLTDGLVEAGDTALLVMPQDLQAPKGRLILPQVQTIRELLDKKCLVFCCTADSLDGMLQTIPAPKLIITDSQVFGEVYEKKPPSSRLTSFSVLMAASKGDIEQFIKGAKAIDGLTAGSRVLIAEACTHAPLTEDIGREKIPAILKKRFGQNIKIDIVSGNDFPADLAAYDLIIHCGACMFNRRYMLARMSQAAAQQTHICNYGIFLAHTTGILDKIAF